MKSPIRKVVQRSPWRTVRLINLPHLQVEGIAAESLYERDFVYRAALYPYLKCIQAQPFRMEVESGSYTPDYLLTFKDESQVVVEVKPEKFLEKQSEALRQAGEALDERRICFRIVSEQVLYRNDINIRVQKIRRYAKCVPDASAVERAFRLLEQYSQASVLQLNEAGVPLPTLLSLIAGHRLQLHTDLHFGPAALVSFPQSVPGVSHALQFNNWLDA